MNQKKVRHATLSAYANKRQLVSSIIGIFCDCEHITDDDGFDSKLNFRLPFYTLLEGLWMFKSDTDEGEVDFKIFGTFEKIKKVFFNFQKFQKNFF